MKKQHTPFWRNPRFRYGSLSTILLCLFLVVMVIVNAMVTTLEKKNGWRVDYSFNALTTQSEKTLEILAGLEHPVHIYALFVKGQEDQPLMELLDRYAAASPLVTWEQADVSLNPGLLTKFHGSTSDDTVSNDSLIVYCEATDRYRILSPADFISLSLNYEEGVYEIAGLTYESKITSAINYVVQDEIPRVMMLQGHGELDENGTAVLADLLEANNFEVQYFRLGDSDVSLEKDDLLAILSPVRDLTDAETQEISAFMAQGGSVLFTCDYSDPLENMPNYAALMRAYGFEAENGIVVASPDEPSTYYDNVRIDLIPEMQSTDVTMSLLEAGADTLLLAGSRAFAIPEDGDRNLVAQVVLQSGSKAYLRDLNSGNLSLEQSDEDECGPFALALQARRITDEGYVSRAFVLGCSTLLTESTIHAMTDAQEFIIRIVEFLLDSEPVDLGIMAKAALRPQLSVESVTAGSVMLVALPLLVVAAAVLVLWPRRNK